MLTRTEHPVAWAMLLYELADAREHLNTLIDEMATVGAVDEADFRAQMGHIFAHLNRSWHGREDVRLGELTGGLHAEWSRFPDDLDPIG